MRLICGLLQLDGADASEELLRLMAAQMDVPRLRPSLSLWREGPVGLAVLDFSARGKPAPALPETAGSIMAADVRLDDPTALARELHRAALPAEDALLLATLERAGCPALDQVFGDFAFARWNRNTKRLTCARDAFGIRPLVYTHKPGAIFAFASLPKALHGSGIVAKQIDEGAFLRRMARNTRSDDCLIAGIKELPPAHFLEISREGISLERYWQIDRAAIGTRQCSPEEAARELRRLVDDAVKCRLARSAETGAHLSGGLDSSAIAVLAARELREQDRTLHAYSVLDRQRNDISLEDETDFVDAVLAEDNDIDWTPIRPSSLSSGHRRVDADGMTLLDEGSPENAICALAEKQGVGQILSGWGGDEAASFNGRGAMAELFLGGRWRTLAREISALKRVRGRPAHRIFAEEVLSYLSPVSAADLAGRIFGKHAKPRISFRQVLTAEASRKLDASDGELRMTPSGRKNRWRLMTSNHIARRAEVWAQIGARYGVAFTFPLLDRRVVEFSLSLPSEFYLRGGFRRRPFRDAMADVLPQRVRLRHQKIAPLPSSMLTLAEKKDNLVAQIDAFEKDACVRRVIDLGNLRQLVDSIPSADLVREQMEGGGSPALASTMIAVTKALAAAAYLKQHGS